MLWLPVGVYSFKYLTHEANENRFLSFYLLVLGALLGMDYASNLVSMYFFYELVTLTALPLVLHSGTKESIARGAEIPVLFHRGRVSGPAGYLLREPLHHAGLRPGRDAGRGRPGELSPAGAGAGVLRGAGLRRQGGPLPAPRLAAHGAPRGPRPRPAPCSRRSSPSPACWASCASSTLSWARTSSAAPGCRWRWLALAHDHGSHGLDDGLVARSSSSAAWPTPPSARSATSSAVSSCSPRRPCRARCCTRSSTRWPRPASS